MLQEGARHGLIEDLIICERPPTAHNVVSGYARQAQVLQHVLMATKVCLHLVPAQVASIASGLSIWSKAGCVAQAACMCHSIVTAKTDYLDSPQAVALQQGWLLPLLRTRSAAQARQQS